MLEKTVIEIKVRFCNDLRDWENIPITMTATPDKRQATKLMHNLKATANAPLISSVRWNERYSRQGHYFVNQTGDSKAYLNK